MQHEISIPAALHSSTVLIVEDDADTQEMLQVLLRGAGYTPQIAGSGEAAFELLERHNIDLVLLDLRLPGMNGFEVCRRVRESDASSVPIMMLTANRERQGVIQGIQTGADDYLTKPFDPDELLIRMERLLQRSQAATNLSQENGALRQMLELVQKQLGEANTSSSTEQLLRREFLHNVATHLQSLTAVIESDFRQTPPGPTREVVQRILGRVRGASLVYSVSELLQNDPVRIDQVIHTIAVALKNIYSPRKRLPINIQGGPLEIPLISAAPLTMIVNELVTNCFKHAFPNQRFGAITINYGLLGREFELHVADDGVGLATPQVSSGRGRTTVIQLATSLQGTAEWQSTQTGTTVTVRFPVE